MRIRQVKPAFFTDSKLAGLSDAARLFYIGLWMLADDEGWLRWDIPEMGAELYGYEGRRSRERKIAKVAEELIAIGRVVVHDCGHAQVPTLKAHQHLAGETRRVRTFATEHSACFRESPQTPADARDAPLRLGKERSGSERIGSVSNGPSAKEKLLAAGMKPELAS